jgi:hypothetical protein
MCSAMRRSGGRCKSAHPISTSAGCDARAISRRIHRRAMNRVRKRSPE